RDVKIKNIKVETQEFFEKYWKKRAGKTQKLIIDVSDNGGGDAPISWYKLFFHVPFQEQYVAFKNIDELHKREEIKRALFYDDPGKFIFYDKIKSSGELKNLTAKDFLPHVPGFCAAEEKDCRDELFVPKEHKFNGEVRIILNQWCHSSCVG